MIRFNWKIYDQNYEEEFEENAIEPNYEEKKEILGIDREYSDYESNIQNCAISDYLIDAYYVSERSNMVEQSYDNSEREEEYCKRLSRLCKDVNSLIGGTKGFIDYSNHLTRHLNEEYGPDRFMTFEENVSGYLDSLYSCIRSEFRNDNMEKKEKYIYAI